MSIEPDFDLVSGPFPQRVERTDPVTGLRRIRTYYDLRSFFEVRELGRGTWTAHSWGHIPRETAAAYVRHIIEPTGVLHSRPFCGDNLHRLTGVGERAVIKWLNDGARWCRRCVE